VPILLLVIVVLAVVLAMVLLAPISLILRYRAGRSRRQARRWAASLNLAALAVSVVLYLASAALTSVWAPLALRFALGGLLAGILLGLLGLVWTRWERRSDGLYFTPNAWLVLFVTLVVAARLAYGAWRLWDTRHMGFDHSSQVFGDSVRGSLTAGGIVLGYYLTYWSGVLRRLAAASR
jgi:amino acid transporter